MDFWVSLRKLGVATKDQAAVIDAQRAEAESLLKEIKRLNDYLALMTNESDPPTEESTSDETT